MRNPSFRSSNLSRAARMSICSLTLLITACSAPMNAMRDQTFQSYASISDRPVTRPVRSISSFTDSLQCMDKLMRDAQIPTTLITSKSIPDFSTRVPVATKDMVITALLQMSRSSNAFRYVDYEVDLIRQDTVQNLSNILLNNNQMQLQRPSLYVSGAISFVDQNVLNNRFQAGVSEDNFDAGYSQNRNATIIGLELHLGDFRTRTMIPGLDSANEVIIGNGGQGLDLAGRIRDYGLQFNIGRDYAQGSGAAVRTLVELGMIELVGKWARIPYWQCLTLEQNHPGFQRQLREWYDEGNPQVHQILMTKSLRARGYLNSSEEKLSPNTMIYRQALARFQTDEGLVVSGVIDFPSYERALRNYVVIDAKGNLASYGWNPKSGQMTKASSQSKTPTGSNLSSSSTLSKHQENPTIDLQIENILMGRNWFELGEQVFISASSSHSAYLACYLSNASGNTMKLIPNAVNPVTYVNAKQTIRLPDWMSPNPGFVIETSQAGKESLLCIGTRDDVVKQLDSRLQGAALTILPEIRGNTEIVQIYRNNLGEDGFFYKEIAWTVIKPQNNSDQDLSSKPKGKPSKAKP